MKEYLYSVCVILVILTVVEFVAPKSLIGKPVKVVVSLISVAIILNPILKLFSLDDSEMVLADQNYTNYLIEVEENAISSQVKTLLELKKYEFSNIESQISFNDEGLKNYLIKIYFSSQVINENISHINNIEEIKKIISEHLLLNNLSVEAVQVDEEES